MRKTLKGQSTSAAAKSPEALGWSTILLVTVVALLFGWPSLHGQFLSGDDTRLVTDQVLVNHPSWKHAWQLLTSVHGDLYQPLAMLTLQANYALAEQAVGGQFGVRPEIFHLTNILLHTANSALVLFIAWRLFTCRRTALLTSLLFATHPLAVEAVAWISGRMILLASFFSLLTILARQWRRPQGEVMPAVAAVGAWVAALLSKVLPTVPIAAGLCEYHRHGRMSVRRWSNYALLMILTAVATYGVFLTTSRFGLIEATGAELTTSLPVRMLLAGRYYLEHYIWPAGLAAWSPPPDNVRPFSSEVGIALIEGIALSLAMLYSWKRNRHVFVGLALFIVLLVPFLGIGAARRQLAADRYMYLPMLGLHLAIASAVASMSQSLTRHKHFAIAKMAFSAFTIAATVSSLLVSWQYTSSWLRSVSRDGRIVEVYPDRVETHAQLAKAYLFEQKADDALQVIAEARQRWPDEPRLASEAGEAYRLKQDWPRALAELGRAAELRPGHTRTRYYYALTLEQMGRAQEARIEYQRIIQMDGGFVPAITALAKNYRLAGQASSAITTYEQALRINPYHRDALFELALLYTQAQNWEKAEPLLRQIVGLDENDAQAWLNLGVVLVNRGRLDEALAIYDRLLRDEPTARTVRLNRASLLTAMNRQGEAEGEYRRILAEPPGDLDAAIALHELLQAGGRHAELVTLWRRMISYDMNRQELWAWQTWAYILAGERAAAEQATRRITNDTEALGFANWAMAYDALQRGDREDFLRSVGPLMILGESASIRREHAQMVLTTLGNMPPQLRESPAGFYSLARALLYAGNMPMARMVAERAAAMTDTAGWATLAREMVAFLDTNQSRGLPTTSPVAISLSLPSLPNFDGRPADGR